MISKKLKKSFTFYIKMMKKSSHTDKEYQLEERVEKFKCEKRKTGSDMRWVYG